MRTTDELHAFVRDMRDNPSEAVVCVDGEIIKPTVATDYTPGQLEDMRLRTEADEMAAALQRYGRSRHAASIAAIAATYADADDNWYEGQARQHRADARAALHMHPALLDMLEGKRISSAAIELARHEAKEVAAREGETCECGHTEHWHANHGRGMCEFGGGCECATFWIDDGRDGPDTDRAYDEWHER